MTADRSSRAPLLLRPLHSWFWFWDRRISSIYRVVAVAVGALTSAWALAAFTSLSRLVAAPISLISWVALAVVQDHDERVVLPLDEEFYEQLRFHLDEVASKAGFTFEGSSAANRARGGADTFTYRDIDADDMLLWIYRDPRRKVMGLAVWADDLDEDPSYLPDELAQRVTTVRDPKSDAQAISEALELWTQDRSVQLPDATGSSGTWFNYNSCH